jgi:hypothetical protein
VYKNKIKTTEQKQKGYGLHRRREQQDERKIKSSSSINKIKG